MLGCLHPLLPPAWCSIPVVFLNFSNFSLQENMLAFFPDKRNTTPSPQDTEAKLWVSGLEGDLLSQLNLPLGLKGASKSPSQNVA